MLVLSWRLRLILILCSVLCVMDCLVKLIVIWVNG